MLVTLAVAGWLVAIGLAVVVWRHRCPAIPMPDRSAPDVSAITHLLLVDASGWPESLRAVRSGVPQALTRAHGKSTATGYPRIGTAAVYQDKG